MFSLRITIDLIATTFGYLILARVYEKYLMYWICAG